ncbi:TPA_exp: Uncharacterized protein A8136_0997 [Trichophyton benhamiae CBS 112371]|uniref:ADA HAT complex component 1 n=1 Tax=Arthroderma benhamiae (strain ATCC MYA-4681 / CBS 112371) TaxID=663331 RepID=D4AUW0_ARTBC|nr:uncharacterized protein ARB_08027 [Trichophyton benhamiae CBS 112371]EFE33275.1 conserved hypothetical protein [Trichophyton benhamiae CBS 112371]DAA76325.1 TPA_exp: Uncharacterized protein A8136_0997 [Trichophyton benhamiae CBS 112371]
MTSLSAGEIPLSALSELLSGYDGTLARVYRDKLTAKAGKAAKPASKALISREKEEEIEDRVKQFVELDSWRYTTLPVTLRERASDNGDQNKKKKGKEKPAHGFINKDEMVQLMDWKLKHGSFRPALMGLIRSNAEAQVESVSKEAFSSLAEDSQAGVFPEAAVQLLCKSFRGVGPATASLILSLAPETSTPFFSDELYYWLCMDLYSRDQQVPRHKLPKLKYNVKEYQDLWDAFTKLRRRIQQLSEESETKQTFSVQDIEKIAFVIGHLEPTVGDSLKETSQPTSDPKPLSEDVNGEPEEEQGRRTRKRKRREA